MTIALGVLASDGVVLAADAQITTGSNKRNEGKISMNLRRPDEGPGYPVGLVITGAGASSSIEHLRQGLTKSFDEGATLVGVPEIGAEFREQLLYFHDYHVTPHGGGELDVWMIVGAMDGSRKGLWVSDKSFVNDASPFAAVGIGGAHASSLMGRLFAPMDMIGAILLSAFVISEVKQAVEGCGNDTDIVGIGKGKAYLVNRSDTRKLGDIFRRYSRIESNRLHGGCRTFCVNGVLRDYRRTHETEDEAGLCIRRVAGRKDD